MFLCYVDMIPKRGQVETLRINKINNKRLERFVYKITIWSLERHGELSRRSSKFISMVMITV